MHISNKIITEHTQFLGHFCFGLEAFPHYSSHADIKCVIVAFTTAWELCQLLLSSMLYHDKLMDQKDSQWPSGQKKELASAMTENSMCSVCVNAPIRGCYHLHECWSCSCMALLGTFHSCLKFKGSRISFLVSNTHINIELFYVAILISCFTIYCLDPTSFLIFNIPWYFYFFKIIFKQGK